MSQITTHILDTSLGKPAEGVSIILEQKSNDAWVKIAEGTTNADGRINDLLAKDAFLEKGTYRLLFKTSAYFSKQDKNTFYPMINIEFSVADRSHYHIPLLLNPFGYSTYRGS